MKQLTLFIKFVFLGDEKFYLRNKNRKQRDAENAPAKREIIWSKNQYGNATFWHKNVLHKN